MSKHLTQQQRYHIEAYKKAGYGNSEIARDLGVHPSTIGRELMKLLDPRVRGIFIFGIYSISMVFVVVGHYDLLKLKDL